MLYQQSQAALVLYQMSQAASVLYQQSQAAEGRSQSSCSSCNWQSLPAGCLSAYFRGRGCQQHAIDRKLNLGMWGASKADLIVCQFHACKTTTCCKAVHDNMGQCIRARASAASAPGLLDRHFTCCKDTTITSDCVLVVRKPSAHQHVGNLHRLEWHAS